MPQTRSQVKKAKLLDYAPYPIRLARKPTRKCVNSKFPSKPAAGSSKSKSQRQPQSKPSLQPVILTERNIPERPRGEVKTYVAPSGKRYRKTLKETMQRWVSDMNMDGCLKQTNPQIERSHEDADTLLETCRHIGKIGQNLNIKDVNGESLLVRVSNGLSYTGTTEPALQDSLYKSAEQALENLLGRDGKGDYKIKLNDDNDSIRHNVKWENSKLEEGVDRQGLVHLGIWANQANTTFGLTSDTRTSCAKRAVHVAKFYEQMAPTLQTVGQLFRALFPDKFKEYEDLFIRSYRDRGANIMASSTYQCFLNMAVLENLQTGPHKDVGDKTDGIVVMFCVGKFTGGRLVLPGLGIQIDYKPGDVILFRSALLEHFIAPWEGHRRAVVMFSKTSAETALEKESKLETS